MILKQSNATPLVIATKTILVLVCILFQMAASSVDIPEGIAAEDAIYEEGVRTVLLHHEGNELSPPFVELNRLGKLRLRFDDLSGDFRDFYYTVFHCTSNWEFTDLDQSDYMTGMYENSINDYDQAFNTYTDFTHYTSSFPNDMSGISVSGNYLLVVYEDGDIENVVLTKRFIVYEQLVKIEPNVKESTVVTERRYDQEVDIRVLHPNFSISNPYRDFALHILQNNRWDNAITNLEPRFVKNSELDYDYGEENNFPGGNEFRQLDLKQTDFITLQIDHITREDDEFHAWLKPDPSRAFLRYATIRDINGRYLVKNDDGFDTHLESDYIWVHFNLPWDYPLAKGSSMNVFGALSDWQAQDAFELEYDYESKAYHGTVLLKQGYYNYIYVISRDGELDSTLVEGNHFATENEYTVLAYNYDMIGDYDRVVGAIFFNSFD